MVGLPVISQRCLILRRLCKLCSLHNPRPANQVPRIARQSCYHVDKGSSLSVFLYVHGLTTRSESNIGTIPLHEFVGLFPTNTDPALVFAATKQIPVMDERWQKARTIVIENGENIDYRPRLTS